MRLFILTSIFLLSANSAFCRGGLAPGEKLVVATCYATSYPEGVKVALGSFIPSESQPMPPEELTCEGVGLSSTPLDNESVDSQPVELETEVEY